MNDRVEILNNLKSSLTSIRRENGFLSTVDKVERGIYTPEDIQERPAITLYNTMSRVIETTFEVSGIRELELIVSGFTLYGSENPNDLDDLTQDLENFFNSKEYNQYYEWTRVGDIKFYEGVSIYPVGIVDMWVYIRHPFNAYES
jgi:hypothetical protein